MCGIVGLLLAAEDGHANQELFDSLTALQHRGQGGPTPFSLYEDLVGVMASHSRRKGSVQCATNGGECS